MAEVFLSGATAGEDWKAPQGLLLPLIYTDSLLLAVYLTNPKYMLQDKPDTWSFILHPQFLNRQAFLTVGLTSSCCLPKHQNTQFWTCVLDHLDGDGRRADSFLPATSNVRIPFPILLFFGPSLTMEIPHILKPRRTIVVLHGL